MHVILKIGMVKITQAFFKHLIIGSIALGSQASMVVEYVTR